MNKLMQRVVTAVVLLAVLLLVFFRLPSPAAVGLIGAFILIAGWEWSGFLSIHALTSRLGNMEEDKLMIVGNHD